MQTIADGWNTQNVAKAVECFTEDAIYIEPPDKQLFRGKEELYHYFGGDTGFDMHLTWHALFFNEDAQTGAGEYTFEMNGITHHGVALVEINKGKIASWREYDIPSEMAYGDFSKAEDKKFKFTIRELLKQETK